MKITCVVVGALDTNCYILEKEESVLIIDPGDNASLISSYISPKKQVLGIIITHSHYDHIEAAEDLLNKYNIRIYNKHNLSEGNHNFSNFSFDVIYTPGHLDDSISLYFKEDKVMFVGDFIFKGGIGRTDMLGANNFDMKQSIKKILKYPTDTIFMPGHYEATTLADEIDNLNYYLTIL